MEHWGGRTVVCKLEGESVQIKEGWDHNSNVILKEVAMEESLGTKISWPSVPTGSRATLHSSLPRAEVLFGIEDFRC